MDKIKRFMLLAITLLMCFLSACTASSQNNEANVSIESSYTAPPSIKEKESTLWLDTYGEEYVELTIYGEIKDFEIVSLLWSDINSELEENESLYYKENMSDEIIILKTVLPCGMPSRMVKWKELSGKEHNYIIVDTSLQVEEI